MTQKANSYSQKVCYLCGLPLRGKRSKDHVPPKQLYAKKIKKNTSLNLLTFPTHEACNKSFQHDEDYFVNSLLPLALDSEAGHARWRDVVEMVGKGQQLPLVQKIVKEFEDRPSGLYLPNGLIVKRIEPARIARVGWKIVRGLYFHHEGRVLPEDTSYKIMDNVIPGEKWSLALERVVSHAQRQGQYPQVFDYKYLYLPQIKWSNIWAFQIWETIILCFAFQNPKSRSASSVER